MTMSDTDLSRARAAPESEKGGTPVPAFPPKVNTRPKSTIRIIPIVATLAVVSLAGLLAWATWDTYMGAPWTRDGTVRAYVVTIAPEVAGRIVQLPVADNQFVHKGDLLMVVDPTDYTIAVSLGEATVAQMKADAQNKAAQAQRRRQLSDLAASDEEKQTYSSSAVSASAAYRQAVANLEQARANLARTRILAPASGYVTNLQARLGDYATVGQRNVSVIDAESFWVDGYFEEFKLPAIHDGDLASIKLMGSKEIIRGHVDSVARGINVPNAQPDQAGLAAVNPIFTWVRLAQRVPVRIHIDQVPSGVRLVAGATATVQIDTEVGQTHR